MREPVFRALYPPRIDQHIKVSVTSKAFLDQRVGFREGNINPWCLLLWALSSNSNSLPRRSNRQRSLATVIISQLILSSKMPHTEKQYFYFSFLLVPQLGEVRETVGSKVKANIFCQFLFCHCGILTCKILLPSISQRWHGKSSGILIQRIGHTGLFPFKQTSDHLWNWSRSYI